MPKIVRALLRVVLVTLLVACSSSPHYVDGYVTPQPAHMTTGVDPVSWPTLVLTSTACPDCSPPRITDLPRPALHRFGDPAVFDRMGAPLPTGWYTAVITPSAEQAARFIMHGFVSDDGGAHWLTEYHVGSAPLALVDVYPDVQIEGPVHLLRIAVTEPCTSSTPPDALIHIRVDELAADCSRVPQTSGLGTDDLATVREIVFTCVGGIEDGAHVVVDIAPGIVSMSGVPLRDLDGRTDVHVELVAGVITTPRVTAALVSATDP